MKYIISILVLAALISSCTVFDRDKSIPAFIHIPKIEANTREPINCLECEGTANSNISDAWVYVNDNLVGIFELPANVPVYQEGHVNIKVGAGIKNSGISSFREMYPFYDFYQASVELVPGTTINFSQDSVSRIEIDPWRRSFPVVQYFENGLKFWNENFQQPALSIETSTNSDTSIMVSSDPSLVFVDEMGSNSRSGIIYLTDEKPFYEGLLDEVFQFPKGSAIYLELNYKTNCPIEVGLYGLDPVEYKIFSKGLYPTETWNKVYLELTAEVAAMYATTNFRVFIESTKPGTIPLGIVQIDNVKLVYPD